ncbi:MAG: hypothetical protein V4448_17340, partial [Pseudomonadota bacterium]
MQPGNVLAARPAALDEFEIAAVTVFATPVVQFVREAHKLGTVWVLLILLCHKSSFALALPQHG